jgi:hypothetical protein
MTTAAGLLPWWWSPRWAARPRQKVRRKNDLDRGWWREEFRISRSGGGYTPTRVIGPGTYPNVGSFGSAIQSGDVWQFHPDAIVTFRWEIHVPDVTILGGTWRLPVQTTQNFSYGQIGIFEPRVTIDGGRFEGGDIQVTVNGAADCKILNTTHVDRSNCAIYLWGPGCHRTEIAGFDIQPQAVTYASVIGAQGQWSNDVYVHDGTFDATEHPSYPGAIGHFGIELIEVPGLRVDNVSGKGGECLFSFPRSNGVTVTRCYLDLRGMNEAFPANPGWGIEFPDSEDCVAGGAPGLGNTFIGDGPGFNQHGVSLNTGSHRAICTWNTASNMSALFDCGGDDPIVTDNCCTNIADVVQYETEGPGLVQARNGSTGCIP